MLSKVEIDVLSLLLSIFSQGPQTFFVYLNPITSIYHLASNATMPLLIVIAGIALLLILIIILKLNAFISFVIVSLVVAIAEGMSLTQTVESIQLGIGNTLGSLVLILGFGAMLGKLVADSGAAQKITTRLVETFGRKNIQWAVVLAGFIVGIPMFYSVGFVILIPLVFTVAATTKLPLLYVGMPMLASLSVTHGYLPPHPAPTAIAGMFGADIGKTLLYGIIIAIPAIILGGPLYARTIRKIEARPLDEFTNHEPLSEEQLPGMVISTITALFPVILIGLSALLILFVPSSSSWYSVVAFAGDPVIAMLASVLLATFTLGIFRGRKMKDIMDTLSHSVSSITMVLLIIAGAGGLKQVLVDSGVSDYIAGLLNGSSLSPLVLAWLIATALRICVGSATVAGLTTAGIVLPLATNGSANTELMVLAIGSGSLMASHVNDGGFWLFKEYFNLSIKDTLVTWTVLETTVGIVGLLGVLIIDWFI